MCQKLLQLIPGDFKCEINPVYKGRANQTKGQEWILVAAV